MANRTLEIRSFIAGTVGFAVLLALIPNTSSAQLGQRLVDEANDHFSAERFDDAIPLYRDHLRDRPNDGASCCRTKTRNCSLESSYRVST